MERGRQEKQEIVERLVRNHSIEKEMLENKITEMKKSLISVEGNYLDTKDKLNN